MLKTAATSSKSGMNSVCTSQRNVFKRHNLVENVNVIPTIYRGFLYNADSTKEFIVIVYFLTAVVCVQIFYNHKVTLLISVKIDNIY